jgi:molybdenum cofactor cytidylyltransferase
MAVTLLLAAGSSRRFGTNKLLAPLSDGTPMVLASAQHLVEAGCTVFAIVGPQHEAVVALLKTAANVRVTVCPSANHGMGNTLAWGVMQSLDANGWLVALGDMPFVDPQTVRELLLRLEQGASIVAPAYQGQRGHPVGFSAHWRENLLRLHGDEGGKGIIAAYPGSLEILHCPDRGVVRDVDRHSDLAS